MKSPMGLGHHPCRGFGSKQSWGPTEMVPTFFELKDHSGPERDRNWAGSHSIWAAQAGTGGCVGKAPRPEYVLHLQDITYLRIAVADTPEVLM